MKRKTVLKAEGNAGEVKITVETVSSGELMRVEHEERHDRLVEATVMGMVGNGTYAHKIKVG